MCKLWHLILGRHVLNIVWKFAQATHGHDGHLPAGTVRRARADHGLRDVNVGGWHAHVAGQSQVTAETAGGLVSTVHAECGDQRAHARSVQANPIMLDEAQFALSVAKAEPAATLDIADINRPDASVVVASLNSDAHHVVKMRFVAPNQGAVLTAHYHHAPRTLLRVAPNDMYAVVAEERPTCSAHLARRLVCVARRVSNSTSTEPTAQSTRRSLLGIDQSAPSVSEFFGNFTVGNEVAATPPCPTCVYNTSQPQLLLTVGDGNASPGGNGPFAEFLCDFRSRNLGLIGELFLDDPTDATQTFSVRNFGDRTTVFTSPVREVVRIDDLALKFLGE